MFFEFHGFIIPLPLFQIQNEILLPVCRPQFNSPAMAKPGLTDSISHSGLTIKARQFLGNVGSRNDSSELEISQCQSGWSLRTEKNTKLFITVNLHLILVEEFEHPSNPRCCVDGGTLTLQRVHRWMVRPTYGWEDPRWVTIIRMYVHSLRYYHPKFLIPSSSTGSRSRDIGPSSCGPTTDNGACRRPEQCALSRSRSSPEQCGYNQQKKVTVSQGHVQISFIGMAQVGHWFKVGWPFVLVR